MKIFISSSKYDRKYEEAIINLLVQQGHEIFHQSLNMKAGDNWFRKINEGIKGFDVIIIIISRFTINSRIALREIESIVLNDISNKDIRIIPVITDRSFPPSYLMKYQYIDFSRGTNYGLEKLGKILSSGKKRIIRKDENIISDHESRNESFIIRLKQSLKSGELTFVCGAGVSIGAKIPSWNDLLIGLLETMIIRISNDHSISLKSVNTKDYRSILNSSALVMGKYLKSNLGKDFLPELRDALYKNNPTTCDLINSIVEVARPQRDGKPLNSIITFNFDGLIEENLEKNNVKYRAIDNEGIRNTADELPIYHVHGYLPRAGKISPNKNIVFSEDSYHTQFIEPFSWSNLIQLNKLSQNTCLFIGLSLTDPNLRRLLDVANRKDPTDNLNHYIIKKTPNLDNNIEKNDELLMFLEEQDANELGLNVIWVKDFNEISELIRKLIE